MSYRRMTRPDSNQEEIVDALRQICVSVWVIGQPADLLTYYPPLRRWRLLEIKPPDTTKKGTKRLRKDQERQTRFLNTYGVDVVRTAEEAIAAVLR